MANSYNGVNGIIFRSVQSATITPTPDVDIHLRVKAANTKGTTIANQLQLLSYPNTGALPTTDSPTAVTGRKLAQDAFEENVFFSITPDSTVSVKDVSCPDA